MSIQTIPETFRPGDLVLVPVRDVTRDGCCGLIDGHWSRAEVVFDPEMLIDGCLYGVVEGSPFEAPHTERVRLIRFTRPEPDGVPMVTDALRSGLRRAQAERKAA